jgi:hypothetical protein
MASVMVDEIRLRAHALPSTNPNRETYVPPTVGVATVGGRFPGFPVHPGGRFAGRPVGWFPLRRAVSRRPVA